MTKREFAVAIRENRVVEAESGEVLPIVQLIRSNPFLECSITNHYYKQYEEGLVYVV